MKRLRLLIVTSAVGLSLLAGLPRSAWSAPAFPHPVGESALLAEDWRTLAGGEAIDCPVGCPVQRALTGYGLMMLNRNNEALVKFLALVTPGERAVWSQWTADLVRRHPERAIAHLVRADALARQGNLDTALSEYAIALGESTSVAVPLKDPAPALIGKGVLHAARLEMDAARIAFDAAVAANAKLAEAYASRANLMLLKRATSAAIKDFEHALSLSPTNALAFNGRGCALLAKGKWMEADADFARAAAEVPLALFIGNRRALHVTVENRVLGPDSPMFRFTDFLDWQALRAATLKSGDLLTSLLGGALPTTLDESMLDNINRRLVDQGFYARARTRLDGSHFPNVLTESIKSTAALRAEVTQALTATESEALRRLNRLLLEQAYPGLIAPHLKRRPGYQLTLTTKGLELKEQLSYKRNLSTGQIVMGQARMDYLYRPLADVLEKIPGVAVIGQQWNRHLALSTQNNKTVAHERQIGDDFRGGGVSSDLSTAVTDRGEWPVVNWFGLVYSTPMEQEK